MTIMQKTKKIISPLRYPGSKNSLVNYIINALEINAIKPSVYVEPFVGGGSIALNLLANELVDQVILIDRDPWITGFWKAVFFDTDWIIDQIRNIEVTIDNWNLYKNSKPRTIRERAITCLFLNRTSFSGILENRAGPLGGRNQSSEYPIDCRFTATTKETIIKRIQTISTYRDRIYKIWNYSWDKGIHKVREAQMRGDLPVDNLFFYFDPPFFEEADALYRYYFDENDHRELRDFLLTLEDKWILSYDSADQVKELYGEAINERTNGTHNHEIELIYTIAKVSTRKKGKEQIISNLEHLPASPMEVDSEE
jgi:DNA adenine methylase